MLLAHCIIEHCHSAIWLNSHVVADVRNNVCAYCLFSGVRCQGTQPYCMVVDNIFYQNGDGIDYWGQANSFLDHNVLSGNRTQYRESAIPGPHDVHLDPRFVDPLKSDYRLAADSPARGAGIEGNDTGLCEDSWTTTSAKREVDRFIGDRAMEPWIKPLIVTDTAWISSLLADLLSIKQCLRL